MPKDQLLASPAQKSSGRARPNIRQKTCGHDHLNLPHFDAGECVAFKKLKSGFSQNGKTQGQKSSYFFSAIRGNLRNLRTALCAPFP